jgi:hypothetical protein
VDACFHAVLSPSRVKRAHKGRLGQIECSANFGRNQLVQTSLFFWHILILIKKIEYKLN